ncbi:MAG TPA: RNA polymerase sigma factor [Candidatus Binatia bacterium]|nr:RNA polymerase sigma factor [Candidatus Binatia bacterium]
MNTMTHEMSEKEAIDRAKKQDPAGLGRLYELHEPRIYLLCLRHTRNVFDAQDLTQDVFIQVFRRINTFQGSAAFTSWLYKVALNFVRLHARRQRRNRQFLVENVTDHTLCSVRSRSTNPAQRVALTQALGNLTPLRREAVFLIDVEGFTHTEAAWRTGVTVTASKSRVHRAHMALRDVLGGKRDPSSSTPNPTYEYQERASFDCV